jgi:hypothetical protein
VAYKTSTHGEHRHVIVDQVLSGTEMRVTPNLADNQFKIELLIAEDCPIRTSCVRLEEGVNSICNHLGSFPSTKDGNGDFNQLTCQYGDEPKILRVNELWVYGCPLGRNCAKCEDLKSINLPSSAKPDKSHVYVTCETRHRKSN